MRPAGMLIHLEHLKCVIKCHRRWGKHGICMGAAWLDQHRWGVGRKGVIWEQTYQISPALRPWASLGHLPVLSGQLFISCLACNLVIFMFLHLLHDHLTSSSSLSTAVLWLHISFIMSIEQHTCIWRVLD